ncbi:MAG: FeoA family protein [Desulfarculaceae bacterium]|jgi:ferrous iron transport protein A
MYRKRRHGWKRNANAQRADEALRGYASESNNCTQAECSLGGVRRGCRCRIRRLHAHGAVRQRLLDMGLIPNAEVEVMRVAPLGDPIEIKVATSFITLRKQEADQIEIINN